MQWRQDYKEEMIVKIVLNPSGTDYCITATTTGHWLPAPTMHSVVTVSHNYSGFHTEHFALVIAHVKQSGGRCGFMPQTYSLLDGGRWDRNGSVFEDYETAEKVGKQMALKTEKDATDRFEAAMERERKLRETQKGSLPEGAPSPQ